MNKNKKPFIGQKIYVPSALYISHGRDDFAGGKAIIDGLHPEKKLPEDHPNYLFISIKERPGFSYNWNYIKDNQKKWKKEYKGQKAHPDPDYSTESNEDMTNVINNVYLSVL